MYTWICWTRLRRDDRADNRDVIVLLRAASWEQWRGSPVAWCILPSLHLITYTVYCFTHLKKKGTCSTLDILRPNI